MNLILWIDKFKPGEVKRSGWIAFQLGLFLLASSAALSVISFLISLTLGMNKRRDSYWSDAWNYPLVLVSILMILSCVQSYSGWLSWLGLANWLPFFWIFWGFQPYLITSAARRKSAICLIMGSIPVLVTGFGQMFFDWNGPWELFDGLIIWHITPGGFPAGRLSGLFDYANIAAAWLALVYPFSLAVLLQPGIYFREKLFAFIYLVSIVGALMLTQSRNGWAALSIPIPFVIGSASWFWLLPILILVSLPFAFVVLPGVPIDLKEFGQAIVPEKIWSRLNDSQFASTRPNSLTRLTQWRLAAELISDRPWLGWGAASFSILYYIRFVNMIGHSHNLFFDLSVSHGLPVAILLIGTVLFLLLKTLRIGVVSSTSIGREDSNYRIFNRAWWSATLILIFFHATDMPMFDSRINILGWVLLAGLRCFLKPLNKPFSNV